MALAASTRSSTCADVRRRATRTLAIGAVLAAAFALAGCDRNAATSYLVPTGVRPPVAGASGRVFGYVHYAPSQRPDLADGPYPPTSVALLRVQDSSVVKLQNLSTGTRAFAFSGVGGGYYLVRAAARGFDTTYVRVHVADAVQDAGDLTLPADPNAYASFVGLIGTWSGYDTDSYFLNLFNSPSLGLWSYPSDFHGDAFVTVPAGPQRFMFVTDNSVPGDFIGWGGDSSVTLTAPVAQQPVTFGHGPAHELKVVFPAAGNWSFVLDEARQTFSVTPYSPTNRPVPHAARRTLR